MSASVTSGEPGDPSRGLSVSFLTTNMLQDLEIKPEERVYEIEPRIRKKGEHFQCPRDRRPGTAYVDVAIDEYAGKATLMLSYGWGYKVHDIVSALRDYCRTRDLKLTEIRVWICCFCVNQHRVKEKQLSGEHVGFEEFVGIFGDRVKGIGHVLGLLSPWRQPLYIKRVWCLFEAWMANKFDTVKMDFVLPEHESENFLSAMEEGGLTEVWETLKSISVEDADAAVPTDKERIFQLIREEGGFAALNKAIMKQLQTWFVQTARSSPNVTASATFSPKLCITIADLLTQLGMNSESSELVQKGIVFCEAKGMKSVDVAMLHLRLGRTHGNRGDQDEAYRECEKALEICQGVRKGDELPTKEEASILQTLASIYRKRGDLTAAFATYDRAFQIWRCYEKDGKLPLDAAWTILNLGMVRHSFDISGQQVPQNAGESLHYFDKAWAVYEHHDKTSIPAAAWVLRNRGVTFTQMGRLVEAEHDFDKAVCIFVDLGQDNVENYAKLRESQGMLYLKQSRYEEATKALNEAHHIFQGMMSPKLASAHVLRSLGDLYVNREDQLSAEVAYQMAREYGANGGPTTAHETKPATLSQPIAIGREFNEKEAQSVWEELDQAIRLQNFQPSAWALVKSECERMERHGLAPTDEEIYDVATAVKHACKALDAGGAGKLSRRELTPVLRRIFLPGDLSDDALEELLNAAPCYDERGMLEYGVLVDWIMEMNAASSEQKK